ncbi:iron chelate uptake ABC transporter family permease subunit, partial [Staphylococcus aureus]|nr:iron chelate uptake ABC transporter family permease subunit [Staphylococcus aureus]
SMTEGIIIMNENTNEQVMIWLVGSLSRMKWDEILTILQWLIVALISTIFIGRQLTIMELCDDIAQGLCQNINKFRI